MPTIKLFEHNGTAHELQLENGQNILHAALEEFVPGLDGDCGGAGACGTCHILVAPEWLDKLSPPDANEQGMLQMRPDRQDNSRLCCQINASDALDGFTAFLPQFQM